MISGKGNILTETLFIFWLPLGLSTNISINEVLEAAVSEDNIETEGANVVGIRSGEWITLGKDKWLMSSISLLQIVMRQIQL